MRWEKRKEQTYLLVNDYNMAVLHVEYLLVNDSNMVVKECRKGMMRPTCIQWYCSSRSLYSVVRSAWVTPAIKTTTGQEDRRTGGQEDRRTGGKG